MTSAVVRAWKFFVAFALVFSTARANETADRTEAPYFRVRSATTSGVDALPLKDTQVDVTIAGLIAEVAVVQTYANESSLPIEATYLFPGSTRAAVHGLTMVVGERVVRAKIQERRQARQTYEQAKSSGRTASLLEQHRPNVFQMNLANIQPGETVRVELRYTELLRVEDGEYEFVFPTVVGPRYAGPPAAGGAAAADTESFANQAQSRLVTTTGGDPTFGFNLLLAAGVPLQRVACDSHPVAIERPDAHTAQLRLDPSTDPTAHTNRDVIVRYQLTGDTAHAGVLTSDAGGGDRYFLAMIQPPARPAPASIPRREYVFVIDVSGSMNGFPLATATALLRGLIGDLRETDAFNLVLFAGTSAVYSPAPVAATPDNLSAAIVFLETQRAGGGTELLPALRQALALPAAAGAARTLVVITDGFVTVETEAFELVRENLGAANCFAFGIGVSVNRHLIEGLARAGMGEPVIISTPAEAPAAAAKFRRYIENPVLTDVRAGFAGIEPLEVTPRAGRLPDVFAQRPVIFFGKCRGIDGAIRVQGRSGDGVFDQTIELAAGGRLDGSRVLELLWARARIAELEDFERAEKTLQIVAAITALGLQHGLLTKHTSFVAVDEIVRPPAAASAIARRPPPPLPPGVRGAEADGAMRVATTPEAGAPSLILIAATSLWWAWRRRMGARKPAV